MEAMKIDLTSKKGKYTVDHNSIVQEIDQVQKKQRVHKAHLADIEREESLLKIQIREAKKDDVCVQSLKKRIKQVRSQIVQVETRLTVKMERLNLVSPLLVTKKSTMFVSLPNPLSCKIHAGRPKKRPLWSPVSSEEPAEPLIGVKEPKKSSLVIF